MRLKLLLAAVLILALSLEESSHVAADFWDGIPIISQIKSAVQAANGDHEAAKKTQENFSKQFLPAAAIRTGVELLKGDTKAAGETVNHFVDNVKDTAKAVPGVGHVIGGIEIATGNKEEGLRTIKGASTSTGALLGGILGGPAGAIAGGAAVDGLITGIDSAVNKEFKPHGVVDYFANFDKKSSGEHFDQLLGFGSEFLLGGGARAKSKPKGRPDEPAQPDQPGRAREDEPATGGERPNDDARTIDTHSSSLRDKERTDNDVAAHSGKTLDEVRAMTDEQKAKVLQNSLNHLPEDFRNKLSLNDFKDVNSFRGCYNCYLCTLAGASGKLIGRLAKNWGDSPAAIKKMENAGGLANDRISSPWVVTRLFQDTEFPHARITNQMNEAGLARELNSRLDQLPENSVYKFGLGYLYESLDSGHIVVGRAWRDSQGLKTLFTDFQVRPDDQMRRFTREVPSGTRDYRVLDLGINEYDLHTPPKPRRFSWESAGPEEIALGSHLPGCTGPCQQVETSRRTTSERLGADLGRTLGRVDFLAIKNTATGARCPWCALAMFAGLTVGDLREGPAVEMKDLSQTPTLDQLLSVFHMLGYPEAELLLSTSDENSIVSFIDNKLAAKGYTRLVLAYEPRDGAADRLNSVLLTGWKNNQGKTEILVTDYNFEPDDPRRFKRSLGELDGGGARKFHLIQPKRVLEVTAESIDAQANEIANEDLDRGAGCQHKRIIGYVASWTRRELTIRLAARYTNLIYAFAGMEADGSLKLARDTLSKQRLNEILIAREAMKKRGKRLSLSVAIGGWANSEHYSNVVHDQEKRANFISHIVALLEIFDGVDIDWEYPGTGGATEGRPEDRNNYIELLKQLRAAMPAGKLLSIAAAAGEEAMRGFDIKQLIELTDWIGVMTYDFNGAWDSKWGAYVGPNAALWHAAPKGYSGRLNVNWAIKQYACRSGQPNKVVMGLPFYGRFWTRTVPGKDDANFALFRMAERVDGKFGGEIFYRDIEATWFRQKGATRNWDDKSKTPWAFEAATSSVLTYDNAESIRLKVAYALEHNLAGVMVWSVDQDDDSLALTNELAKACAPTPNEVKFKCNPLGEERRWWQWTENQTNAGMCGMNAPLYKGFYARCDPDDPGFGCCGKFGYCGSGDEYCACEECVDYTKDPQLLVKEPVKPSRPVQWHTGFDSVKPGEARCGSMAPPLNGFKAICNPDDDHHHCCSPHGYCGSGADFCDCTGCKNYRQISEADSLKKVRPADEITWHVGFGQVKPGEPRCGPEAPKVRDREATCDPDDDANHCCAPSGYCGSGADFCECDGCRDSRK